MQELVCSMRKANGKLKIEVVHGERLLMRLEVKYQVFEYIEVYYNRKQLHAKFGYVSPEAFEAKKVA
jgi:transposase InsO family protein